MGLFLDHFSRDGETGSSDFARLWDVLHSVILGALAWHAFKMGNDFNGDVPETVDLTWFSC